MEDQPSESNKNTSTNIRDFTRDGTSKTEPSLKARGKRFAKKDPYRQAQRNRSDSRQQQTDRKPYQSSQSTPLSNITGIQGYPIRSFFTIHASDSGLLELCAIVFNSIRGRDSKLTTTVTLPQFQYVTFLCYLNRLVQCGLTKGYQLGIPGASELRTAAREIQLPEVVVRYIETLGTVKLLSGATVAPLVPRTFPNPMFTVDPRQLLIEGGRIVDNLPVHYVPIDYDWIIAWNQNTTRPSRLSMHFRSVELLAFEGRNELLVSVEQQDDLVKPFAPQMMSEQEMQLGAAYHWRDRGGENSELLFGAFSCRECLPALVIEHETTRSFTSM